MDGVKILDRETKANFEIRIINKVTGKSRTLSVFSPGETEDGLREKIARSLVKKPQPISFFGEKT